MKIAIAIYAFAMVLANLLVLKFGPVASPFIAFVLIGLDLALRDWLHMRLKVWQMGLLIITTGLLTFVFNPSAGQIAMASSVAFMLAAATDWAVFVKLKGSWVRRANGSNVAGAAVDSLAFPTIAFGVLMPEIVLMQFIAKLAGGYIWTLAIYKMHQQNNS